MSFLDSNSPVRTSSTLSVIVLLVTFFGMFTDFFQQFAITSDQLTLMSLADDLLRNPYFDVHLWLFPRAPFFFPDFALVTLLKAFVHKDVIVAFVMQVYQLAGTTVLAGLTLCQLLPKERCADGLKIYATLIIAAFISTHYAPIASGFVYAFLSLSHAGALMIAMVCGLMFAKERYVRPSSVIDLTISILLTILGMVSDKLFIAIFTLPVLFTAGVEFLLTRRLTVFVIIAVQMIGVSTLVLLDHSLFFQVAPSLSLNLANSLTNVLTSVAQLPSFFRCLIGIGLLNVLIVSVFLARVVVRRQTMDASARLMCFVIASVAFNIVLCVLLWADVSLSFARYAVMVQFAIPLLLAVSGAQMLARSEFRYLTTAALILSATVGSALASNWGTPNSMIRQQDADAERLNACVRSYGLHSGLAQYWLARRLSSSTDWVVQIDQLEPAYPRVFFWGSDIMWFFRKMNGGVENPHDFVIVDGFSAETLESQLGIPARYVDCSNWRLALYDEKTLGHRLTIQLERSTALDHTEAYLPKSVQRSIVRDSTDFGLADLSLRTGQRTSDGASVNSTSGGGYFLYGPYATFAAGSYRVTFGFTCTGSLDGTQFDVSAESGKQVIATWPFSGNPNLCDGTPQTATMAFDLTQTASLVETHAIYGGTGRLTVTSLRVARQSSAPDEGED